jgi:hypothetical protein
LLTKNAGSVDPFLAGDLQRMSAELNSVLARFNV